MVHVTHRQVAPCSVILRYSFPPPLTLVPHHYNYRQPWLASRLAAPSESGTPMKRQPLSVQWYRILRSRRYARVPLHSVRGSSCILFYLSESVIESVTPSLASNCQEFCSPNPKPVVEFFSPSMVAMQLVPWIWCSSVSMRFRVFSLIRGYPYCVTRKSTVCSVYKFRIRRRDACDVSYNSDTNPRSREILYRIWYKNVIKEVCSRIHAILGAYYFYMTLVIYKWPINFPSPWKLTFSFFSQWHCAITFHHCVRSVTLSRTYRWNTWWCTVSKERIQFDFSLFCFSLIVSPTSLFSFDSNVKFYAFRLPRIASFNNKRWLQIACALEARQIMNAWIREDQLRFSSQKISIIVETSHYRFRSNILTYPDEKISLISVKMLYANDWFYLNAYLYVYI